MRFSHRLLLSLSMIALAAGGSNLSAALPPVAPIVTAEEVRAAAASVPVARIDFMVPEKEVAAEDALSRRFFNQGEEHRYSGLTTADWTAKWDLFSEALVARAREQGLDAASLEGGLRALNRGRNRQTMLEPAFQEEIFLPGTPPETIAAADKKVKEQRAEALRERDRNPQEWYNEKLALVPVGAYLARHAGGECWIVVCKWEYLPKAGSSPLRHIMVWALDTKTAAVVGYVTCD